MIAIPDVNKPKKVDGIGISFHFEDGHIETHIIDIEEIIDIVKCWECEYYKGHEEYCEIDHFAREYGFCYSGKKRKDEN